MISYNISPHNLLLVFVSKQSLNSAPQVEHADGKNISFQIFTVVAVSWELEQKLFALFFLCHSPI